MMRNYSWDTNIEEYYRNLCSGKNAKNIFLYYGTSKLNLDTNKDNEIDPMYSIKNKIAPRVFEYGIGFYLTPYINIAIGYALTSKIENLNTNSDNDISNHIRGLNKSCNIHIYELDLHTSPYDIKYCINGNDYIRELCTTIWGYHNNLFYHKRNDLTVGRLCGHSWDDEFKNTHPYFSNIIQDPFCEDTHSFIWRCIHSIKEIPDNDRRYTLPIQFCLHKDRRSIIKHKHISYSAYELLNHRNIMFELLQSISIDNGGD